MRSIILFAAASALAAPAVQSEDRFPTLRSDQFEWGIGLGALIEDEGYGALGFETEGQPVIYVASDRFRFFANQADWQFVKTENVMLSLKVEGRFDGFEAEDDALFNQMDEREGGWYGGLRGEFKTRVANFVGEWVTELTGESSGTYGSMGAYWVLDLPYGHLAPKIALEYYDADYTNYYYGVRPHEGTFERPAYDADSVMNVDIGVDYIHEFADGHRFISSAKYRSYGSEVTDSPLIDASGSARFILGYLYVF